MKGHLTILTLSMFILFSSSAFAQTSEVTRIREHLRTVEDHLRARDVSDWPQELQEARRQRLDDLAAYREAGEFPRNTDYPDARVPYFIDDEGTACAMAQLMIDSGHADDARTIAARENNAYIAEMTSPELEAWLPTSGLTAEEAIWIQPSYGFCDEVIATIDGPPSAECGESITFQAAPVSEETCDSTYGWYLTNGELDGADWDSAEPPGPYLGGEQNLEVTLPSNLSESVCYEFQMLVQNQGYRDAAAYEVNVTCGGSEPLPDCGGAVDVPCDSPFGTPCPGEEPVNNQTNNQTTNNDTTGTNNQTTPGDDAPIDDEPTVDDEPEGGCSVAATPATAAVWLAILALVGFRRRRREA